MSTTKSIATVLIRGSHVTVEMIVDWNHLALMLADRALVNKGGVSRIKHHAVVGRIVKKEPAT